MGGRLQITPHNVRDGAGKLDAEKDAVTALRVPDTGAASAGLAGFATATSLTGAHEAVESSLKVVGGRFERMAQLCRDTANTFELADLVAPGTLKPSWMSQQIGDGLAAMGDLNRSIPKP